MVKIYVLDRDVLLHCPDALTYFGDNLIVLPMVVIEGLKPCEKRSEQENRNALRVLRYLDEMKKGRRNFKKGIKTAGGGSIRIEVNRKKVVKAMADVVDFHDPKHRVLAVAYNLSYTKRAKKRRGKRVILVTKDINLRLKADAYHIEAQDFEGDKVKFCDDDYRGLKDLEVGEEVFDAVLAGDIEDVKLPELFPNEFLRINCQSLDKQAIVRKKNGALISLPKITNLSGVRPRNFEQELSLDLLLDPSIKIVTMTGPAGTGKTLLALIAGLELSGANSLYDNILVWRAIMPLGNDLGYLPGDEQDKLFPWMQPIHDNLKSIVIERNKVGIPYAKGTIQYQVDQLLKTVVCLESISGVRGRSIRRRFIIVDEAQNLTPHEVKTIISRAGEGTKMVLTGDPYQIDNIDLDSRSNGLSYAIEKLSGQKIYGHISLQKIERSALATAAVEFL